PPGGGGAPGAGGGGGGGAPRGRGGGGGGGPGPGGGGGRQHGPRRLWDAAEAAYRWWTDRGRPPLPVWEWTVAPDRQRVTLPPTT
ncbi:hypothetical protein LCD36_29335, partial [Saccharopolyspora sp. 6T]|nr:hypothetical protein [Saccharopolyspora sp. 6T]